MAPAGKAAGDRRKSGGRAGGMTVTLTVSPEKLRVLLESPSDSPVDEGSPAKETKESHESPATSATLPTSTAVNGENASDSNPATPAANGTPAPPVMGPPTEGPQKKGVKRSANGIGPDGLPKQRGKPGPKKKPRLEDGTIDPNGTTGRGAGAAHKLGPKANQGAINAGLRALDRSGKPCRKWTRGGFNLKSFTGVIWEIPRWTAPPKPLPESSADGSAAASADSSTKENQDEAGAGPVKSEANSVTNSGADLEATGAQSLAANSPAPIAITAA